MQRLTDTNQRQGVDARIRRITKFLARQAGFSHALAVGRGDELVLDQALPDADTALKALREVLHRRRTSSALPHGDVRMGMMPARLARLESQVQACVRGLQRAGVEFVLIWQIAGRLPELACTAGPDGEGLVRKVMALLADGARLRQQQMSCVEGELVHW